MIARIGQGILSGLVFIGLLITAPIWVFLLFWFVARSNHDDILEPVHDRAVDDVLDALTARARARDLDRIEGRWTL